MALAVTSVSPSFGSRTTGHRHRQPRLSVRCRLVFGGFVNCRAPVEAAMSPRFSFVQDKTFTLRSPWI